MGGVAQLVARLTRNVSGVGLSPYCLVLVGSRNGFESGLHKQKLLVSQSN